MDYNQRFYLEKLAQGYNELKAARIAMKLLQDDKEKTPETIENSLLFEVFTLRKLATIKEAEAKIHSMKKALRTATENKYKIDAEVERLLKEFELDKM